jgi:Synergist-CTERM protein sorting domain-containing protein
MRKGVREVINRIHHLGKRFALTAASIVLCLILSVASADAHMYFSFPSDDKPGAGATYVYTTFALNPPNADESGYGAIKYEITGGVISPSTQLVPASFAFSDSKTGKEYSGAELEEAAEDAVDSRKSRVSVKGGETSAFITNAEYANDEVYEGTTYHQEFTCRSKAFINLTGDGFSTRTLLTSGLEIIPLSDLADVTPSSKLKLKVLLDGSPLAGVGVCVTHEGAPFTDLNDEITAIRLKQTGSDGTVEFTMPSVGGKTYIYAMHLDSRTTETGFYGAMSSLSFNISASFSANATDLLVRAGQKGTNMDFVGANTMSSLRDYLSLLGILDLVSEPTGSISLVSGRPGQLGDIGAAFSVRMDVSGARNADGSELKGTSGTEQRINLSREILGERTFNEMLDFLREVHSEKENNPQYEMAERGEFYVAPTPGDFLERFGLTVMGSFSGGDPVDVSGILQLGIELNESDFEAGNIYGLLGGMFADSGPVGGSYWLDVSEMFGVEHYLFAIIYDGVSDNNLDFAYWVVRAEDTVEEGSGGSGGCASGTFALAVIALAAVSAIRKRR